MNNRDVVRRFLRQHGASAVGPTPPQPILPPESEGDDDEKLENVKLDVEQVPSLWKAIPVPEAPARPGEFPERFIDGSHVGHPVLCVRTAAGWPIPMLLGEVGAVALRSVGRKLEREFATVDRVLSFVADPFPWEEIESFASALVNAPELKLRVLPANLPDLTKYSPFDYEIMQSQARARAQQEMSTLERLALAVDRSLPTLVDGPLKRVTGEPAADSPLLVGVAKSQTASYLHDDGLRTLLNLRPGQRTPVFKIVGRAGIREAQFSVASWYLKLSGGPRIAPNWGFVRVEIPSVQFEQQFVADFQFINRLSRWLIDARCRAESYARMPVSLEPIVRAEEGLKPLLTPFPVLANRLYRSAGLFRGNDL
jgi:hypothetical protein